MRLTDLRPRFLQRIDDTSWMSRDVPLSKADGICFLCPVCFRLNGGPVGTHSVICWQPHVPQTTSPVPGRWLFSGTGYEDLTLTAGSSSILLNDEGGCKAHFYIRNGEVVPA